MPPSTNTLMLVPYEDVPHAAERLDDDPHDQHAEPPGECEGTAAPRGTLTEVGNAFRLADLAGDRLRYVKAWRSWLAWDGRRWCRDAVGVEIVEAKNVVAALFDEASRLAKQAAGGVEGADQRAKDVLAFARRSATDRAVQAMAHLAQSDPRIAAVAESFDVDPWLLNVTNGTLDLQTGILHQHDPGRLITRLAPCAYDDAALCPRWDAFLARILPDASVRDWLQRFVGYALTGSAEEQVLVFFVGGGANGKSTLLGVIQDILGDYAAQGSPGLLLAAERGGDELGRRQRATLRGRRLVLCQEIEAGRFLNEAQVKQITGGDKIVAARLYEDESEFSPTHKLVVAANHRPQVRGQDHGIWRRILPVPFDVTITDDERDPNLQAKLMDEAPGILAWAVRGCAAWRRRGLAPPAAIRAAAAEYRCAEDLLGEFLDEATAPDPEGSVSTADLHRMYSSWLRGRGEAPTRQATLTSLLGARGFKAGRTRVNGRQVRAVLGLRLRGRDA